MKYLISIDLEDFRLQLPSGTSALPPAVDHLVQRYLDFFRQLEVRVTFFTVGNIVNLYPGLVQRILTEGHEIACHGNDHTPLDELNEYSFQKDLEKNLELLAREGATNIVGFRAPMFSMTGSSQWAYDVLQKLGFRYSSSVLPAKTPLYGWPEFGSEPKEIRGVLELPMSVRRIGAIDVPFGGGIYFRVLPKWILKRLFARSSHLVMGYFHPCDIDEAQPWVMHPYIKNPLMNSMMFYNRRGLLEKIRRIYQEMQLSSVPYRDFIEIYPN
jgi:polysaccharide deacetylase family protein (PEP-CTERM system associated)